MNITYSNKIYIEKPTKELEKWCNDSLIISNPEYIKKLQMNKWLGNTPRKIYLYERIGDTLVLPYGVKSTIQKVEKETLIIKEDLANNKPIKFINTMTPYDYQELPIDVMSSYDNGILVAPPSSGKTNIGLSVIAKLERPAIWVTHTKVLLKQSMDRAKEMFPDLPKNALGTITEGKVDIGTHITFATVQTLAKLDLSQYNKIWDVMLVDECHRVGGNATQVTMFYKVLTSLKARYRYGVTATPERSDGTTKAMISLIGNIIFQLDRKNVEHKTTKVKIKYILTDFMPNIADITETDGTLNNNKMLNALIKDKERNKIIARLLNSLNTKKIVVLIDRLDHFNYVSEFLSNDTKNKAGLVTGTSKKELNRFINGEINILFATYQLLSEGFDYPELEYLFLISPKKMERVLTQSIGRVERKSEGKEYGIVYDFVDKFMYYKSMLAKRRRIYKKMGYEEV